MLTKTLVAVLLPLALFSGGCGTPLLLAGGVVGLSLIKQNADREEASRRIEAARQKDLQRKHEQERQRAERERLATIERQRKEELARLREAQQHRAQQARGESAARAFVESLENALRRGDWSQDVNEVVKQTSVVAIPDVSPELRQRVHLATGLYAWVCDAPAKAREQFAVAKRLGATNPRCVCPDVWSPAALETFIHTGRGPPPT